MQMQVNGIEYQMPNGYIEIEKENCYSPHIDYLQSTLDCSLKNKKQAVVIAFALITTKPDDTPRGKRIREVFGNPYRINLKAIKVEVDTTLSKMKYLDTLQLKKVNADRGIVYNMKIDNKYMGVYGQCKKVELYKDNVGRVEILFFYNKKDDALVDEEINKTWGMLKFK